MIKLFSLKQQQKDGEQTSRSGTNKKTSPAQLRIQKGSFNLNYIFHILIANDHQKNVIVFDTIIFLHVAVCFLISN